MKKRRKWKRSASNMCTPRYGSKTKKIFFYKKCCQKSWSNWGEKPQILSTRENKKKQKKKRKRKSLNWKKYWEKVKNEKKLMTQIEQGRNKTNMKKWKKNVTNWKKKRKNQKIGWKSKTFKKQMKQIEQKMKIIFNKEINENIWKI